MHTHTYILTYTQATCKHTYMQYAHNSTYISKLKVMLTYINTYTEDTYMHTYILTLTIHTYIQTLHTLHTLHTYVHFELCPEMFSDELLQGLHPLIGHVSLNAQGILHTDRAEVIMGRPRYCRRVVHRAAGGI